MLKANKEKQAWKLVVEHIDEPYPEEIDPLSNPPAEYWERRWKAWRIWRSDAKEALFAITGQRFSSKKEAKVWIRANGKLPEDPLIHQCLFVYASDMGMVSNIHRPHRKPGRNFFRDVMMASLDHAVWFHRPFRMDDWLLFTVAVGARGAPPSSSSLQTSP